MTTFTSATNGAMESDVAKWFARALLPIIVTISLAIFSWNATRVVTTLDSHGEKLEAISRQPDTVETKVGLFQEVMNFLTKQRDSDAAAERQVQSDHEARIRQLEKAR
jgi:hypothetical protein